MAPITYLQLFEEEHPKYKIAEWEEKMSARSKPSSRTTSNQEPPFALTEHDHEHWIQVANDFLYSNEAKNDKYLIQIVPEIPILSSLDKEADVVRVASRHFTDPLIMALNARNPGAMKEHSEKEVHGLKVDYAITTADSKRAAVVLVEYKRCCYIHEQQFRDAICTRDKLDQMIQDQKDLGTVTLEKGSNAWCYVKQATAYHLKTSCNYVALCDYENLILLKYLGNGNLDSAEVTIVPRTCFRKALLGFSIEAYEESTK